MRWLATVFLLLTLAEALSDELPHAAIEKTGDWFCQTFEGFTGSYSTLPVGFSVADSDMRVLGEGDAELFCGASTGGVSKGGCYAWLLPDGGRALGSQPTADHFTPGYFLLAVSNASPEDVREVVAEYEVVWLNNGSSNRSTRIGFEFGTESARFCVIDAARVETPGAREEPAAWRGWTVRAVLPVGGRLPPGGLLFLRWVISDVSGAGTRDECGITAFRLKLRKPAGFALSVR